MTKLAQGLGPLRDLESVLGPSSSVSPTEEWYRAIENDIKNIPAFCEFFKVNVPAAQVMLPAHKSSHFSKQIHPGYLNFPTHHQRSDRFDEMYELFNIPF